jgi:undecaprenyl-diphosphatase
MDTSLFFFINHGYHNEILDSVMLFLTNRSYILFIALIGLFCIKDWRKGIAVFLLAAMGFFVADGVVDILKHLIERPRPCHVSDEVRLLVDCLKSYSFPSGHATTSFAVASIIGHYVRRAAVPAFALAVLVAFSRIYVGVHYPTDVIGGAAIGGGIAGIIIVLRHYPLDHLK